MVTSMCTIIGSQASVVSKLHKRRLRLIYVLYIKTLEDSYLSVCVQCLMSQISEYKSRNFRVNCVYNLLRVSAEARPKDALLITADFATCSDAGSGFELLRCVRLLNCFIVLVAEAMAAKSLLTYPDGDRSACDSAWLPMRGSTEVR